MAAAGPGGGAGEGLQVGLQIVGIVGKGVDIFFAQNDGALIVSGFGADEVGYGIVDVDDFFLGSGDKGDICRGSLQRGNANDTLR